jgi:hypothetical protein
MCSAPGLLRDVVSYGARHRGVLSSEFNKKQLDV